MFVVKREKKRKESGHMISSTPNIHGTAAEQTPNDKQNSEVNTEQLHNTSLTINVCSPSK